MTKSKGEDKLNRRGRPIRFQGDIESRAFAPRQNPLPAPDLAIDAAPYVCLVVNMSWVSHVLGVIETLNQDDAWQGDADEKDRARQEIQKLIEQLMTGDNCVIDPCCPEDQVLLQQIIELNTTIVSNQVTLINNTSTLITNSTTVINQNNTQIIENYINNYNQWVYNNHEVNVLNQMIYDGTPQSIAPNLPTDDWSSDAIEASTDALCLACKRYLESVLNTLHFALALTVIAASAAEGAALVIGVGLGVITAGASVVCGWALAGLISAGTAVALDIMNNPVTQRKVLCCMFDTLKNQPITPESFKTIGTGCIDDDNPNVATLADMVHQGAQVESQYLAFLRLLSESQGSGNDNDCDCCQEIEDYEIVPVNDSVVTKIDDFHYRVEQTAYEVIDKGGIAGEVRVYTAIVKEREGRCVRYVGGSGGAANNYFGVDCTGTPISGTGGAGGDLIQNGWEQWVGVDDDPDIHLDVILEIACPNLGIVP